MEFIKKTLKEIDVKENNLYDFIYNLFFLAELEESKEDIKNGRVYTLKEVIKEMEAKYEYYLNQKS